MSLRVCCWKRLRLVVLSWGMHAWEVNELPADSAAPAAPPTDDGGDWTSAVAAPAPAPAPAPVVADVRPPTPTQPTVHSWPPP